MGHITCRIETTDEEEARAKVSSSGGMPVSMTPTADGLAILARIRLPSLFRSTRTNTLRCEPTATRTSELVDLGLIPWDAPPHPLDVPFSVEPTNMVMLGVGGLGSWARPC